jgi:hypothetical protein
VLDDGEDIGSRHVSESDVVSWRESEDVTNALHTASAEKLRFEI